MRLSLQSRRNLRAPYSHLDADQGMLSRFSVCRHPRRRSNSRRGTYIVPFYFIVVTDSVEHHLLQVHERRIVLQAQIRLIYDALVS